MTRSLPDQCLARHRPQAPHLAPPSDRLMTAPSIEQSARMIRQDFGAGISAFCSENARFQPSVNAGGCWSPAFAGATNERARTTIDETIGHFLSSHQIATNTPVRALAFLVHIFTALGAALGLLALFAAVRDEWAMMFLWLGAGPAGRRHRRHVCARRCTWPNGCRAGPATRSTWWSISSPTFSCPPTRSWRAASCRWRLACRPGSLS